MIIVYTHLVRLRPSSLMVSNRRCSSRCRRRRCHHHHTLLTRHLNVALITEFGSSTPEIAADVVTETDDDFDAKEADLMRDRGCASGRTDLAPAAIPRGMIWALSGTTTSLYFSLPLEDHKRYRSRQDEHYRFIRSLSAGAPYIWSWEISSFLEKRNCGLSSDIIIDTGKIQLFSDELILRS